jgi:hypothetical protein
MRWRSALLLADLSDFCCSRVLGLLLCLVAAFASAGEVKVLTDANFASETASGVWFVEFYARWTVFSRFSHHC